MNREEDCRSCKTVPALVVLGVISLCLLGAIKLKSTPNVAPEVIQSFDILKYQIISLKADSVKRELRVNLIKKVENARAAYLFGRPCTSATIVQAFLDETRALRRGKSPRVAEDLYNCGQILHHALLMYLTPEERAGRFRQQRGM